MSSTNAVNNVARITLRGGKPTLIHLIELPLVNSRYPPDIKKPPSLLMGVFLKRSLY